MSDTIIVRRYRLTYGGADDGDLRRWRLRRVPERRGGADGAAPERPSGAGGRQDRSAMYASPART
jgi:hypothetical protein